MTVSFHSLRASTTASPELAATKRKEANPRNAKATMGRTMNRFWSIETSPKRGILVVGEFGSEGSLRVRLATNGSNFLVGSGSEGVDIISGGGVGSGVAFSGVGVTSSPSSTEDMDSVAVTHGFDVVELRCLT